AVVRRRRRGAGSLPMALGLVLALLAGCTTPPAAGQPAATRTAGAGAAPLTLIVTASDLAVGPHPFAFALLDEHNPPVPPPVTVTFYDLSGAQRVAMTTAEATWRRPLSEWNRGVFKTDVSFERPGPYGVEASITSASGAPQLVRTRFDVRA